MLRTYGFSQPFTPNQKARAIRLMIDYPELSMVIIAERLGVSKSVIHELNRVHKIRVKGTERTEDAVCTLPT